MKPRKLQKLLTIDFEKVANALMNETHHGQVYLDIAEGLYKVDPFILNTTPVFWQYTIWGHLSCAMMHAIKLFDDNASAYTIPKFLEMSRLRAADFPSADSAKILKLVTEHQERIKKLTKPIKELRRRRNQVLAHISEQLVLNAEQKRKRVLTIAQIRKVLADAAGIVNSITLEWGCFTTTGYSHTDDYRRVVSMVNDYLCKQAEQHDDEFTKYGEGFKLPPYARPRDCPAEPALARRSQGPNLFVNNLLQAERGPIRSRKPDTAREIVEPHLSMRYGRG